MRSRDLRSRLVRRASKINLFLPDPLSERLAAYYDLLVRWNRKINLTSIEDVDEAIDRLLLEPLVAVRHFPAGVRRLMDIGSGGGSPAIPFKLALPDIDLTMVEVKARKSAFLREAIRQLALDHTQVETARYEELLARPELHEAFDAVSLRAVRTEARVLTTLQAFLTAGGTLVLFRGPEGPAIPTTVVPPLEWSGTYPLIDSLQSRVTLLTKRRIG
ncbi:MAG TPA: 16S rRNA (guanine(527)-N(7))-methyltransferase RsmG [Vicinamibacterales bacterium]|nr:16S rRNA (guanine(527)-N(7))-methyltransferase RsmG [Vicinamibacterales bacterium]